MLCSLLACNCNVVNCNLVKLETGWVVKLTLWYGNYKIDGVVLKQLIAKHSIYPAELYETIPQRQQYAQFS